MQKVAHTRLLWIRPGVQAACSPTLAPLSLLHTGASPCCAQQRPGKSLVERAAPHTPAPACTPGPVLCHRAPTPPPACPAPLPRCPCSEQLGRPMHATQRASPTATRAPAGVQQLPRWLDGRRSARAARSRCAAQPPARPTRPAGTRGTRHTARRGPRAMRGRPA